MAAVIADSEMTTDSADLKMIQAMDEIAATATGTVTPPSSQSSARPPNAPPRRRQGTVCGEAEAECDSDVEMTEEESAAQLRVSLDAIRRHLFVEGRQVGVPLSPTGDDNLVERIRSYMSDGGRTPNEHASAEAESDVDDGLETDHDDVDDATDDEHETVEHVEEVESSDLQKPNKEPLMVSVPLWLFLTTMISFVAYMTFVIYILSWECRMPIRQ